MLMKILSALLEGSLTRRGFRILLNQIPMRAGTRARLYLGERPHYLWCAWHAALLAKRLGMQGVTLVEFGVAGGNGLVFLERIAPLIEEELGIAVAICGFDTGEGLPEVVDHRDLPYWFRTNQYRMDVDRLKRRLQRSQLLLGDVRETVPKFLESAGPPIGSIFHDLDFYSSTRNSFRIFDIDRDRVLPRVFNYFDDVKGSQLEMYGCHSGELLAIHEFNRTNERRKIVLNQNLLAEPIPWSHQIFYYHDFDHPLYNRFVGDAQQEEIEQALRLKG